MASNPYAVTVTATDGSVSVQQSFAWTVTPRITLLNPGPQDSAAGDSISLQLRPPRPLVHSRTARLVYQPAWASTTRAWSAAPSTGASNATPYTVTVTATDGISSASQTFAWTVSALVLQTTADQTNLDGDSVSLALVSHYQGSGTLTYTATGLPTGLTIDSSTGVISGRCGPRGRY